jgi:hypothetical protein
MAISTYQTLKDSIISWSKRDDIDLLVDDFIRLTEVDMFKRTKYHERLEIKEEETTSTASVSTKFFALPDNYSTWRSVKIIVDSEYYDLKYRNPESMKRRDSTGIPCFFTIGSQVELDITPDQAYSIEVNYFKKPAALTSAAPTNIVLTNHPDIYLHGALYFLFKYSQDQQQAQSHLDLYIDAIDGANNSDRDGRYGPAPTMTVSGATP